MLPPDLQITIFPEKKLQKFHDSIIQQIETMERKSFPKNEMMAIKEEISKKINKMLIAYCKIIDDDKKCNNNNNNNNNKKFEIKILGYLIYSYTSSTTTLPLTKILKLCVHPLYQKKGLGTRLLNNLFEKTGVPQRSKAKLHVDTKREGAICLYQKVGFKIIEQINNYYSVGRDAWFMEYSEE
ncbi:hypothetical protein Glove_315g71 [Diversispora epigaea]|uniref:N-acetyltransferase domain-containing protein n=1 Tax=Diversispora epigaea TaxID=1348612 RepID=A0A397HWA9_9GLOM|nr:hypothetical protein Glove_315g72 [Diversispora epigaea]RHZ65474.1 hypothetical protein Glove_315g71 [Diversispora epigaea]